MNKAALALAEKRGAKIVKGSKPKLTENYPESLKGGPVPPQQIDALILSSSATLTAVEQVKLLAESISTLLAQKTESRQKPPAYKFTVVRDRNNRMSEILAQPVDGDDR
jgi:hypothetical protein